MHCLNVQSQPFFLPEPPIGKVRENTDHRERHLPLKLLKYSHIFAYLPKVVRNISFRHPVKKKSQHQQDTKRPSYQRNGNREVWFLFLTSAWERIQVLVTFASQIKNLNEDVKSASLWCYQWKQTFQQTKSCWNQKKKKLFPCIIPTWHAITCVCLLQNSKRPFQYKHFTLFRVILWFNNI